MVLEGSTPDMDSTAREGDPVLPSYVLPGIVTLALGLRALMAVRTSVMFEDGPHFLEIATRFTEGDFAGGLAHPYHPLYSALIALFNLVLGDHEVAALAVSVLGGTVGVVASFYFLKAAFDARVAALGAFLFAISPYAVRFTADVQSEGVYLAFFLVGLALLYRGVMDRDPAVLFAAGSSAGFAYLARPEGAGLVVVGCVLIANDAVRRRIAVWQASKSMAMLGGGALLVAAPYLWVLAGGEQGGALSGKKSVLRTLGMSSDGAELWWLAAGLALAVALFVWAIKRDGLRGVPRSRSVTAIAIGVVLLAVVAWLGELREFLTVALSTVRHEVAILLVVGLWVCSRTSAKPRDTFIGVALILYLVVLVGLLANYGYLSRRHMLPLVPLVLGYAGIGALGLVERVRTRLPSQAPGALVAGLAVLLLAIAAPKALHDHREDVMAQRLAAEWLREQSGLEPGRVASNKRRTGYYADRPWRALTQGVELRDFDDLAAERVRYIVVDDRVLGFRDHMVPAPGFTLRELHRVAEGGRVAMVYELSRGRSTVPTGAAISAGPPDGVRDRAEH